MSTNVYRMYIKSNRMYAQLAKICQNFYMKSIDNVGKICPLRSIDKYP